MAEITPDEAHAFFERWELVSKAQLEELRRTPMQTKLLQLAALMASRHLFGAEQDREEGVRLVRDRWARLRQALGG